MNNKCIMIIDDDVHDIYFTHRVILENNVDDIVITIDSALGALAYLKAKTAPIPDLIFLDIYMPVMDGWEFLNEYCLLDEKVRSGIMIVMLATSGNPAYIEKANKWDCISDYITKPLTRERMKEISERFLRSGAHAGNGNV